MQEIENDSVVQEKMVEFENIDETIDERELPSQKRQMSPRSRFLLRINGLLQQRVNVNAALAENEELLEQGDSDIEDLAGIIEWQRAEIIRYDTLISMHKEHAIEMNYALKRNPKTGRYIISSRPDDTDIISSKKIHEGITAFFDAVLKELNDELTELDVQLIHAQEEQIRLIREKERKIIDTSKEFKRIETVNDRINQAEKMQKDLLMFLNNY